MSDGETTFVLVTELCSLAEPDRTQIVDLQQFISKYGGQEKYLKLYLRIFKCILKGVKILHAKKRVHRDLKPQNVFLSGNMT